MMVVFFFFTVIILLNVLIGKLKSISYNSRKDRCRIVL